MKSPWNLLSHVWDFLDDKTYMILMKETRNALQKYAYTYTCAIKRFPLWNPLEISLKLLEIPWNLNKDIIYYYIIYFWWFWRWINFRNVHLTLSDKTQTFPPFPPLYPLKTSLRGNLKLKLNNFDVGYIWTFISMYF